MEVKIVSLSSPTGLLQNQGIRTAEELLVYIARVSNPANQLNTETSDKLIRYMIDHKHWSPFDMANMCVGVTTSKAIAIQILRHWSIKPQEFSQRYAEATGIEPIEIRLQAKANRQSSTEVIGELTNEEGITFRLDKYTDIPELIQWMEEVSTNMEKTMDLYRRGLKLGVAKETARFILPMATSTTIYLNGSIRSWIHYMEQRCDAHAQKEHQQVAGLVQELFKQNFPNISKALNLI